MCNPALIMGMQAFGAVQQAGAARQEGEGKNAYYQFLANQNLKQANAVTTTADANVGIVSSAAAREETNLNRSVSTVVGAQKAQGAASGVYSGSGTAEDIARDTASKAELDRAAIRTNANLRTQAIAKGAADTSGALRDQAYGFQQAGANASQAGRTNAETSLLTGATQVASNYYKWKLTQPAKSKDPLADTYGGFF